jgi:hypothetical protein
LRLSVIVSIVLLAGAGGWRFGAAYCHGAKSWSIRPQKGRESETRWSSRQGVEQTEMKSPVIFKDGSSAYESANWRGKWVVVLNSGELLKDENNRMRYFESNEEAVAALKEMGQGE